MQNNCGFIKTIKTHAPKASPIVKLQQQREKQRQWQRTDKRKVYE